MSSDDQIPIGGGLPPLGLGPSLEEEEQAMKKGKGRLMALMIGLPVLVVAIVVVFIVMSGGDEAHRTLGRNVNGLRQQQFDPFWGCVLDGIDLERVDNNAVLVSEIHQRAEGARRAAWATHVLDECMPILEELEAGLQALIPPADLHAKVQELEAHTASLRSSWSGFVAFVQGLGRDPYDRAAAEPYVTTIARGWYDYRRVHAAINAEIRDVIAAE